MLRTELEASGVMMEEGRQALLKTITDVLHSSFAPLILFRSSILHRAGGLWHDDGGRAPALSEQPLLMVH